MESGLGAFRLYGHMGEVYASGGSRIHTPMGFKMHRSAHAQVAESALPPGDMRSVHSLYVDVSARNTALLPSNRGRRLLFGEGLSMEVHEHSKRSSHPPHPPRFGRNRGLRRKQSQKGVRVTKRAVYRLPSPPVPAGQQGPESAYPYAGLRAFAGAPAGNCGP